MASHGTEAARVLDLQLETLWSKVSIYEQWVGSLGVPLYTDYYVPDLRTLELGEWAERECKVAFLQLVGAAHSRGHEHVPVRLRGLEVAVLRLTQPAGAVLAQLEHPPNRLGGALDLRDEVRTRLAPPAAALAPAPSLLARSRAGLGRTHPIG